MNILTHILVANFLFPLLTAGICLLVWAGGRIRGVRGLLRAFTAEWLSWSWRERRAKLGARLVLGVTAGALAIVGTIVLNAGARWYWELCLAEFVLVNSLVAWMAVPYLGTNDAPRWFRHADRGSGPPRYRRWEP
jgi:hypothetical protein